MGKNNLILGTGRGKLGDIVFYRTGGEQRFRTRVRPNNPRTDAQILQRCVVSTAVKFYSLYSSIGDHAFQNYVGALKNHQRYMKLNIDYLRRVALQNIESWSPIKFETSNYGNFTYKDSMNVALNKYQVSEGDLPSIQTTVSENQGNTQVQLGSVMSKAQDAVTYQDIVDMLGIEAGDQLTLMYIKTYDNTGYIERIKIGRIIMSPNDGDMSKTFLPSANANKENIEDVTLITQAYGDGNTSSRLVMYIKSENGATINVDNSAWAIIVSRREGDRWKRSTSYIEVGNESILNKQTLINAMASYLPNDTSSRYLDQANNGNSSETAWDDVRPRNSEVDILIEERTNRKTKNKENC